jgi:hypothetical protein
MIAVVCGNITNLRVNFAGSRPATELLVAEATWATDLSTNLGSMPALPSQTSRGFLPWRFADAGPRVRGATFMGRHPKTFTFPDFDAGNHQVRSPPTIGIGGSLAAPPLPHHRTYGSVYGGSRSCANALRSMSGDRAI